VLPIPTPTLAQTAYNTGPGYLKMVVALPRAARVINFLDLPALKSLAAMRQRECHLVPARRPSGSPLDHRFHDETNQHRACTERDCCEALQTL
jgi:hypothetical protein